MATSTPSTGYPDATNTGLPAGVTLTPSGNLVITQAGAVISGLNITGTVEIDAPNVTLIDCKITSPAFAIVNIASGVTGTVVQNCEINGTGSNNAGSIGIFGSGTFTGNNIYNVENGIAISQGSTSTVIENNYIHDLLASGTPHYDGIQIDGGISNVTISHNTVINQNNETSAIMIDNYFGAISNISVSNNLLSGGDYTVYDDSQFNGGSITGVSFTNNHMGTGIYGYTAFDAVGPTYTGNVNDAATLITTLNTAANSGSTTSSTGSTGSTAPAAPSIASWSPDTGVVGDGITDSSTLTLKGTAAAGSTVKVYDGSTLIGTVTANSTGAWTDTTSTLSNAKHVLTATATDSSSHTSAASAAVNVTVDTVAPAAPVLISDSVVNTNHVLVSGTAEANSTVTVYDGTSAVGTAATNSSGSWSATTSALSSGSNVLTATATDAAGNVSAHSPGLDPVIPATTTSTHSVAFTSLTENASHVATIQGTADANSVVKVFGGYTATGALIGTATANSSGVWTFQTGALDDKVHTFSAQEVDSSGNILAKTSGYAVLSSSSGNLLTSVGGNDVFLANGHPDTFVFHANFGHDVIQNFAAAGTTHDVIQFSSSEFSNFASVLSHAAQVGQDTVISSGNDTLTLKNIKVGALTAQDFHFA